SFVLPQQLTEPMNQLPTKRCRSVPPGRGEGFGGQGHRPLRRCRRVQLHRKQLLPGDRTARGSGRPDRLWHSGQAAALQRTTRTFGKDLGLGQGTSVHVCLSSSRGALWSLHTLPSPQASVHPRSKDRTAPRSTSITTPARNTFRHTKGKDLAEPACPHSCTLEQIFAPQQLTAPCTTTSPPKRPARLCPPPNWSWPVLASTQRSRCSPPTCAPAPTRFGPGKPWPSTVLACGPKVSGPAWPVRTTAPCTGRVWYWRPGYVLGGQIFPCPRPTGPTCCTYWRWSRAVSPTSTFPRANGGSG